MKAFRKWKCKWLEWEKEDIGQEEENVGGLKWKEKQKRRIKTKKVRKGAVKRERKRPDGRTKEKEIKKRKAGWITGFQCILMRLMKKLLFSVGVYALLARHILI